jgi:LruC domain-containing protein
MKKILLFVALFGTIIVSSCKKATDSPATTPTTGIDAINVPAGFNWQSAHTLTVSTTITDSRFQGAVHNISIYDGDPYNGGKLLASGSATLTSAFVSKINIPNTLTDLYVVKTSPDNSKIIQKVSVGITDIALSFGATNPSVGSIQAPGKLQVLGGTTPTSPDCSSGCTVPVITTNTSNVNVTNGEVLCITGNNITVSFASVNGGTVRVCGTNVTLSNYNFSNGSSIIVTTSGSANLSGINFNSSTSSLVNFGTVNYTGSFPDNGIFSNYGTFNCSGDFNLNSGAGVFTNDGTMSISGSFNNDAKVIATNNGSITVGSNFQQNGGSATFVNNCSLFVGGDYNQSAAVSNYSYIKVGGATTINSSTILNMYNSAMFTTKHFLLDGSTIAGNGSTSLFQITTGDAKVQNSGANITGPISVCAKGNFSTTYLTKGATLDCNLYIAKTGCNPDGNGTATVIDTDGDGVADILDAFPTDPTKAYISSGGIGTVAFEDQWPSKGDYDMNDVVMNYHYHVITNASNVVVQVTATFNLLATGGNIGRGFGVQFPITRNTVSGLTSTLAGATLEAGQTNAVITLFSNQRPLMTTWNTQPGIAQSPTVADSISFTVTNGPTLSAFGEDGYNPFIWNMGSDNRRREVHLTGKIPTQLADQGLFGTSADNTSVAASRYYVSKTGLPYAISVPTATFSYPIEGTDITLVYLNFAQWAQSGGSLFTDWYSNIAVGYRNTSLIYTK